MSVSSCLTIDRSLELKITDDRIRSEIKYLCYGILYLIVSILARAEGINHYRYRPGNTYGIGSLDLTLIGKAGSNYIFSDMSKSISSRTVNLCRVLSAEGSAAVSCSSAVGINDDFSSRKTCISLGL